MIRSIPAIVCLLIALFTAGAFAQSGEIYKSGGGLFGKSTLATGGYDTVDLSAGKLVKGSAAARDMCFYKDAKWLFSGKNNRDEFRKNPDKYRPQYGGYCAWAIAAKGRLYKGDPRFNRVIDGKLYLNYDADVQAMWNKDPAGFIKTADCLWQNAQKCSHIRNAAQNKNCRESAQCPPPPGARKAPVLEKIHFLTGRAGSAPPRCPGEPVA